MDMSLKGLDMAETVEFYAAHEARLTDRIGGLLEAPARPLNVIFETMKHSSLDADDVSRLLSRFPERCDARTRLANVMGMPPLWFHKESTAESPRPTNVKEEALSPTAFIPSYYSPQKNTEGAFVAEVELYNLKTANLATGMQRIIHAQGVMHEAVHALLLPGLHEAGYAHIPGQVIRMPNEAEMTLGEALERYRAIAKQYPPISRYASMYYGQMDSDQPFTKFTAISEQLCEAVPAYFLGMTAHDNPTIAIEPLPENDARRRFVEDFLNATIVLAKA